VNAVDEFHDAALRRQVWLIRYASGLRDRLIAILNKSDAPLAAAMREQLEQLEGLSPQQFTRRRAAIEAAIEAVVSVRDAAFESVRAEFESELIGLAEHEAEWTARTIRASIPVDGLNVIEVPVERVVAAVRARPFQGRYLRDWMPQLADTDRSRVVETVRQGILEGRTIDEMVRGIRGTRAKKYEDGILHITRRNAEAVVRTAVNHTSNVGREAVFEANSDIIAGEKWTATLDGRTTPICQSRDGKIVINPGHDGEVPDDLPLLKPQSARPPAHWGCRSLMVAIFSLVGISEQKGARPFVRDTATGKKRQVNFKKGAKASGVSLAEYRDRWYRENVGQVPSGVTYDQWLRRQPQSFQDDVLGKGRADLFRDGMSLDRFVDQSGKRITLAELRASSD
jgi:SPP1 gp7 family putative phage head morphogenesis protein